MEPIAKRRIHHSRASARCLPPPDGPAAAAQALRGAGPLQAVPARSQHEAHPQADVQISGHVTPHVRLHSRISPNRDAVMMSRSAAICPRGRCRPLWNVFLSCICLRFSEPASIYRHFACLLAVVAHRERKR